MRTQALAVALSPEQQRRLAQLEACVEHRLTTWIEPARALREIRVARLWVGKASTFERYAKKRFGFGVRRINQQIAAVEVVDNTENKCSQAVRNEAQARYLAQLTAETQPRAWESALEFARGRGREVTAADVRRVVHSQFRQHLRRLPRKRYERPSLSWDSVRRALEQTAQHVRFMVNTGPPRPEDEHAVRELLHEMEAALLGPPVWERDVVEVTAETTVNVDMRDSAHGSPS